MKINIEKLENIAKVIAGQSPISSYYNDKGEGYPFLQGKTDFGKLYPKARTWCTKPKKIAENKDILLSVRAPVGSVNIANTDVCIGRGICAIRANDKCYYKYLYYYLKTHEREIQRYQTGSTFKSITVAKIKQLQIPLPENLDEQIKIANLLTQVETLITKREESIRLLDELLRSSFLDMFGDPNKFQYKTIEEIASDELYSLSSGPFGSNLTSKHYTSSGVIILRGKNITSGKIDLSDIKFISEEKAIELKRSEIKPNDIVIIAVGSSGYALRIPKTLPRAIISQNFNKVTPNTNIVLPIYLEYIINSEIIQMQFRKVMVNGGRSFLSLTNIKKIKIPCPPISLQNKFTTIVQQVEETKEKYQKSLDELHDLFGSLSQRAFQGELRL